MYRKVTVIKAELNNAQVDLEALVDADDASKADELDKLTASIKSLDEELASAEKYEKARAEILARNTAAKPAAKQPPLEQESVEPQSKIPAVAKAQKSKHFASSEDAYTSGMYFASLSGDVRAGEILAAQSVGTDGKGGFTVPDPLSNALINLLETRGIARQVCKRIVMGALTWTVPKLTAHASVMYPAEAGTITDSDVTFSQITMTAKKIAALVKMSTEISEDSIISMMDTVVESIAYAVATAEDQNLFNGVSSAINATGLKGDTNIAETTVASVAAMDLADLTATTVAIGNPIVGAVNEWYMNPTLFHGPIRDLLNAAGGNTLVHYEEGLKPRLLGYPVNFVNVMPGASATTSQDLLIAFGDMSMAYYFGDRRSWSFKVLNELYAESDQVGIIGTERIDIVSANPELLSKVTIV